MTKQPTGRVGPAPQTNVRTDVTALAIAAVVAGLSAYAFVAIGTRALGAEGFSPVSLLWTLWAISSAALVFPVQHWVIRTVEAEGNESSIRRGLPRLALITLMVGALLWAASSLAGDRLFVRETALFALLAGLVPVGAVVMGLLRGTLAGRGRFIATGSVIAGESLVRLIGAALLVVAGATAGGFGIVLVSGFLVAIFGFRTLRYSDDGATADGDASPIAFLGGFATGNLMSQVILTGSPLFLATLGGSQVAITGLFSALALFRAPFLLVSGVAPRITGVLTKMVVDGRLDQLRKVRLYTATASAVGALAGGLVGWLAGPALVTGIFGADIVVERSIAAVIAAGSVLAVANLLLTLVLVAQANTASLARAWGVGIVANAVLIVMPGLDLIERVTGGFLVGELATLVVMFVATGRDRSQNSEAALSSPA